MKRILIGVIATLCLLVAAAAAYRHFALVEPSLAAIRNQLRDPESAQFRNVRYFGDWTRAGGVVCGEVNAKNGFGGFSGFHWFTAHESSISAEPVMSEFYRQQCEKTFPEVAPWWHLRW